MDAPEAEIGSIDSVTRNAVIDAKAEYSRTREGLFVGYRKSTAGGDRQNAFVLSDEPVPACAGLRRR